MNALQIMIMWGALAAIGIPMMIGNVMLAFATIRNKRIADAVVAKNITTQRDIFEQTKRDLE